MYILTSNMDPRPRPEPPAAGLAPPSYYSYNMVICMLSVRNHLILVIIRNSYNMVICMLHVIW